MLKIEFYRFFFNPNIVPEYCCYCVLVKNSSIKNLMAFLNPNDTISRKYEKSC
jgi:hypothetical protein